MRGRSIYLAATVAFFALTGGVALADCAKAAVTGTVLFVTDRQPLPDDQLFSGERGMSSNRVPIITSGVVSNPVDKKHAIRCVSKTGFFGAIQKRFDKKQGREVLVYVPGYYTSFKTAAENALALQAILRFRGPVVLYSWPSKVTSRLTYINDETNAEWSISHFTDFLALLQAKAPGTKVSFATHSLGSRFATAGLRFIRHSGCKACFGRAALFASDVDSDTLHGELVSMNLCKGKPQSNPVASAAVTLYVSNKDLALRQSQKVHGHQRAGQAGSEIIICGGVDTIDVSYYKSSDKVQHSYQIDKPVIADAARAFAGIPPTSPRRALKRMTRPAGRYYELIPGVQAARDS